MQRITEQMPAKEMRERMNRIDAELDKLDEVLDHIGKMLFWTLLIAIAIVSAYVGVVLATAIVKILK